MGNLTLQNKQTNKHIEQTDVILQNWSKWSFKIFFLLYIISLLWFELCMFCAKFEMYILNTLIKTLICIIIRAE